MIAHTFTTSDGIELAYYGDDNTDPWADAQGSVLSST